MKDTERRIIKVAKDVDIFLKNFLKKNLLKISIQEAILPRTNFYAINKVFLNCLRFNSEHFYPSLMLYMNSLITNSDKSLLIDGVESSLLLTSIVELETKNFRLLEKKLYF